MGGGTFDVSILTIDKGEHENDSEMYQVIATGGDDYLGGKDIDNAMLDFVITEFNKKYPDIDIKNNPEAVYRITEKIVIAKHQLGLGSEMAEIRESYIALDKYNKSVNIEVTMSKSKFNLIIQKYVTKTMDITREVLKKSKLKIDEIKKVVLVGGSSRIEEVKNKLKEMFGSDKIENSVNPDEAVGIGALILCKSMHDDESKEENPLVLMDVNSLNLGIKTVGDVVAVIIKEGESLPTEGRQTFTTHQDNQTSVQIEVYQGSRPLTKYCKKIGEFRLDQIPPEPRGKPEIEVVFKMDSNSIVTVTATDKKTGRTKEVKLQPEIGITDSEKKEMKKRAEEMFERDQKELELITQRNKLEADIYMILDKKSELGDNVNETLKTQISEFESSANKLISDISIDDVKVYTAKIEEGHKIIQELFTLEQSVKKPSDTSTNNESNNSETSDEETVKPDNTEDNTENNT